MSGHLQLFAYLVIFPLFLIILITAPLWLPVLLVGVGGLVGRGCQ